MLILFVAFANLKSNNANAKLPDQIDTSKYAIFNYDNEHWPISFDKDSKSCILSLSDIEQIEYLLNKEVVKINKEAKRRVIRNPSKFYKQLIAINNWKGEKVVWVNCMCDIISSPDWKKKNC